MISVADNVQAAGTTIADATPLPGWTSVVTGGSPGGAVKLEIVTGTVRVLNRWPGVATLPVYPPDATYQIEGFAQGAPAGVRMEASFSLAPGSTTWRAS